MVSVRNTLRGAGFLSKVGLWLSLQGEWGMFSDQGLGDSGNTARSYPVSTQERTWAYGIMSYPSRSPPPHLPYSFQLSLEYLAVFPRLLVVIIEATPGLK